MEEPLRTAPCECLLAGLPGSTLAYKAETSLYILSVLVLQCLIRNASCCGGRRVEALIMSLLLPRMKPCPPLLVAPRQHKIRGSPLSHPLLLKHKRSQKMMAKEVEMCLTILMIFQMEKNLNLSEERNLVQMSKNLRMRRREKGHTPHQERRRKRRSLCPTLPV